MEIKIVMDNINYGDVISKCLPLLRDKFKDKEGAVPKIISGIEKLPPSLSKTMIDALPKETKDELAAFMINKNKERIISAIEQYAEKNGVELKIDDIIVESDN